MKAASSSSTPRGQTPARCCLPICEKIWIRESQRWCKKVSNDSWYIDMIEDELSKAKYIQQNSFWRQSRGQVLWPHPSALDFWAGLCLTGVNIAHWLEQRINTDVEEALLATDWPYIFPWSCWSGPQCTLEELLDLTLSFWEDYEFTLLIQKLGHYTCTQWPLNCTNFLWDEIATLLERQPAEVQTSLEGGRWLE